ncbi:DUF4214 domain-containing protein [Pseudochelatococcus sp. B33]
MAIGDYVPPEPAPAPEVRYIAGEGSDISTSTYYGTVRWWSGYGRSVVSSGTGDDIFYIPSGRTSIYGGDGIDTAIFERARDDYKFNRTVTPTSIEDHDETLMTWLEDIERIQFSDGVLAVDVNGNAGQAFRLYQSAFDRAPDLDGLKYWIDVLDDGNDLAFVADRFIDSQEFRIIYGESISNAAFVDALYQNVLGRGGDEGGITYWNEELNSGRQSRTDVLIGFSESEENIIGVADELINGIWLG